MPQKKKKKPQPKRPPAPAKFTIGTRVRVTPGTTVPDFEDIPLGGWAGTITALNQKSSPPLYDIQWNQHTLDHMHPVYRKRCERDGLGLESMCLYETDIVPDTGSPVIIEQPSQIVTRPLNPKDEGDRIRVVFGLTSDDPLPDVDEKTLRKYHRYLAEHLAFPFEATYTDEMGFMRDRRYAITIVGLLGDEFEDDMYGLFCMARHERRQMDVPLADIEVKKGNPNRQVVADYSSWFVNNG